jgi:hypothetical protein
MKTNRRGMGTALATLAACAAAAHAGTASAASRFNANLATELTYTDNVQLAPPGGEEGDTVLYVAPGFSFTSESPRFQSEVEYRLSGYLFASDSDYNETYHQFQADANAEVLRELFFLEGHARMGQTVIDPELQIPTSNLTQSANRTDVQSFDVTPEFRRRLFGHVDGSLGYQYGQVRYPDADFSGSALEDVNNHELRASLRRDVDQGTTGWSVAYTRQRIEYAFDASDVRYDVLEAEVDQPLSSSFGLLLQGGAESDLTVDQTTGSLDERFWQAGIRWSPSSKHMLRLLAGERFYGNSYEASYAYAGRRLRSGLEYSERPTTQALDVARRPVFLSDPSQIDPSLTPITPDLYVSKLGRAWATLTGRRNTITLQLMQQRRTYLRSDQDESEAIANAAWTYRFGPRTAFDVGASATRTEFRVTDREDWLVNWSVAMRREVGPRTTVDLTFRHFQRDSDVTDPALQFLFYRENALTLGVRFSVR